MMVSAKTRLRLAEAPPEPGAPCNDMTAPPSLRDGRQPLRDRPASTTPRFGAAAGQRYDLASPPATSCRCRPGGHGRHDEVPLRRADGHSHVLYNHDKLLGRYPAHRSQTATPPWPATLRGDGTRDGRTMISVVLNADDTYRISSA